MQKELHSSAGRSIVYEKVGVIIQSIERCGAMPYLCAIKKKFSAENGIRLTIKKFKKYESKYFKMAEGGAWCTEAADWVARRSS